MPQRESEGQIRSEKVEVRGGKDSPSETLQLPVSHSHSVEDLREPGDALLLGHHLVGDGDDGRDLPVRAGLSLEGDGLLIVGIPKSSWWFRGFPLDEGSGPVDDGRDYGGREVGGLRGGEVELSLKVVDDWRNEVAEGEKSATEREGRERTRRGETIGC